MEFDKPVVLPRHIPEIVSVYPFGKVIKCANLGGIPNNTYKVIAQEKTFVVRIYSIGQSSLDHIKIEIDILEHLRQQNFISPRLLAGTNEKLLQFWGKYPVIATEFIPGVMADTVPMTPKIAHNIGKLLNQFRHAMESYTPKAIPKAEHFFEKAELIVSTITQDLSKRGWEMDITQVPTQWNRSKQELLKHMQNFEINIIHSDYWPPNLKLKGKEIVALMDFDDWSYGPMFFDLVVAFVECAMIGGKQVDETVAKALFKGYFSSGGELTQLEQRLFPDAIEMYCSLFLAYNIVQAPEFEEASVYLIRLEHFITQDANKKFRQLIHEVIINAKK